MTHDEIHAAISDKLKELEAELNGKESDRQFSISIGAPDGDFDEGHNFSVRNFMVTATIQFGKPRS